MGEETSQGITRRDLLRRGAVLGGAVVWTTPVVQTLGMGRAFAQTTSPTGGKDISYLVIAWSCDGGAWRHTKFDENGNAEAGNLPDCNEKVAALGSTPDNNPGFVVSVDGPCATITVPDLGGTDCTVKVFLKAGSAQSTTDPCQERTLSAGAGTKPPECTT